MVFTDKELVCAECSTPFPFTANEQTFYAERGFTSEPKRCASCRAARKAAGPERSAGGGREMHDATCASCGTQTRVPFRPTGSRPVYCRDCFRS